MSTRCAILALIAAVYLVTAGNSVHGQTTSPTPSNLVPAPPQPPTPAPQEGAPAEPFLLRPGHYVYPAPYSPDYFSPHLRPFPDYSCLQRRPGGFARTPGGRSGCVPGSGYFQGWNYGGVPYYWDVADAYAAGRYDADREYVWYIASQRAGQLLNQFREQFDNAILSFRGGRYDRALVSLLGAADKNHGSGAARLHAAHALFALGRYREGAQFLARAFELSPSLVFKEYDIRDEYGNRADFDRQLAALRDHVARQPNDASGHLMLGYVTFYTEGPGAAWQSLENANRLNPGSYFIPKLLKVARMTRSAGGPGIASGSTPPPVTEMSPIPPPEPMDPSILPGADRPDPRARPDLNAPAGRQRNLRADPATIKLARSIHD